MALTLPARSAATMALTLPALLPRRHCRRRCRRCATFLVCSLNVCYTWHRITILTCSSLQIPQDSGFRLILEQINLAPK